MVKESIYPTDAEFQRIARRDGKTIEWDRLSN